MNILNKFLKANYTKKPRKIVKKEIETSPEQIESARVK